MAAAKVLDVEWKFGVTAATSECDKVGISYLHMKITISPETLGDKPRTVFLEMSLPQFYEFLHKLEKAKSSLEYMT